MIKKSTIITYLVFAFSLAWVTWGLLALLGGGLSSPLATIIMPISMWTPAAAAWITKKLNGGTRILEPCLRPKIKSNIRWYLCAWLLPVVLSTLGGILYFCIFADQFDPGMGNLRMALESAQPGIVLTDSALQAALFSRIFLTVTVSSILTMLFALGEEIGWRGFLFPAVRSRTTVVKAHILCGIVWGLWHAPALLMGHSYGTAYPGFPWLGILAFCLTCTSIGIFFSYVTSKSGSIWPAALAHGTFNAVSLPTLFLTKELPEDFAFFYGVISCIPFLLCGMVLIMVSTRQKKVTDNLFSEGK